MVTTKLTSNKAALWTLVGVVGTGIMGGMSTMFYIGRESVTRSDLADCRTDIKMQINKDIQDTKERVKDQIEVGVAEVKVEVADVKAEIGNIRREVGEIKGEVGEIKGELGVVKGMLTGEVGVFNGELTSMKHKLKHLDDTIQKLNCQDNTA